MNRLINESPQSPSPLRAGNKSCSPDSCSERLLPAKREVIPRTSIISYTCRANLHLPPNQKLGNAADRCRTQGYCLNPGSYDTVPHVSCQSTMHGSTITILWLHLPSLAETLFDPSYDGASSTISCHDMACDKNALKVTIMPVQRSFAAPLPLSSFTASITRLRPFSAFFR